MIHLVPSGLVTEELAMARAENKLLNEAKLQICSGSQHNATILDHRIARYGCRHGDTLSLKQCRDQEMQLYMP